MDYELAKELKDAGFVWQRKYACTICGYSKTNRSTWCDLGCGSDYPEMKDVTGDGIFGFPTLSELIEACGEDFFILAHDEDGGWSAQDHGKFGRTIGKGSTPDEAVARLWLALRGASEVPETPR